MRRSDSIYVPTEDGGCIEFQTRFMCIRYGPWTDWHGGPGAPDLGQHDKIELRLRNGRSDVMLESPHNNERFWAHHPNGNWNNVHDGSRDILAYRTVWFLFEERGDNPYPAWEPK